MSAKFRIDTITLGTTGGDVQYNFSSDITILSGPTGVGKTSLLELIKFGLGGNGKLSPIARKDVHETSIDISIAEHRYNLRRSLDSRKKKIVRVWNLTTNERLQDHHAGETLPSVNSLLMTALGFPADMRAAARSGTSSKSGARITFNDILSFLYVAQYDINRDIANSMDSYLNPKRQAVFELLFGLTNSETLSLRSNFNILKSEIESSKIEYKNILSFMNESQTTTRADAEQAFSEAAETEQQSIERLQGLRDDVDPIQDRETHTMRDLLAEAELNLSEARTVLRSTDREIDEYAAERRRVAQDLDRLRRAKDAGLRLANIEFAFCPRCMQGVSTRETPVNSCRLCLQPEPDTDTAEVKAADTYEMQQLEAQIGEIDDQLLAFQNQLRLGAETVQKRGELVLNLSALIDERSRNRITPRLQAYTDVMTSLAVARTRQEQLEMVLRQWDRANQLGEIVEDLTKRRERTKNEISSVETYMSKRRSHLIDELSQEFERAVFALGVPGVKTASIDENSYLPFLNGARVQEYSSGGGAITATQVAYWTSLLRVALTVSDTQYPGFLMIDSPQLALNTSESIATAMYQQLAMLVKDFPGNVQIIVADNEIPASFEQKFDELEFTYDNPTVPTVVHPGPASVKTINLETADS